MTRLLALVLACCWTMAACETRHPAASETSAHVEAPTGPVVLRWQRLVDDEGKTCDRCGNTEQAIAEAEPQLRQVLAPLGLQLEVRKEALSHAAFEANPGESNRIWIDGRSLEELLGAKVGKSNCCKACGDKDCRTLEVDGKVHEEIPARLIVRAGMLAAAKRPSTCAERTGSSEAKACCGTDCCKPPATAEKK